MYKVLSLIKKHVIVGALMIAVIALAVSHFQIEISAKGFQNKVLSFEENTNLESGTDKELSVQQGEAQQYPASSLRHPNCVMKLQHGYPTSNTYNPNTPYNLSFYVSNQSGFQDVNGDNLTDYVYVNTSYGGTNPQSTYTGCVYLNNGNGWTLAHACRANTVIDLGTGAILEAEYRGDCAGTPSSTE